MCSNSPTISPADGTRIFLWCSVRPEPVIRHSSARAVRVGFVHIAAGGGRGAVRHPAAAPAHAAAPRAARSRRRRQPAHTARPAPRHTPLTDHATIGHVNNLTSAQNFFKSSD